MTAYLFFAFTVLMNAVYSIAMKPVNMSCTKEAHFPLFNLCFASAAFVCALSCALIMGKSLLLPAEGIIAAAAYGVLGCGAVFSNMKALRKGPLSLTCLIANFSLLLPLAYSFLWLHEAATPGRIIGIILIFVCMIIFINPKYAGEKLTFGWLALSLCLMILNGTIALIGKIYTLHTDCMYQYPFMVYAFGFQIIAAAILYFCMSGREAVENTGVFRNAGSAGLLVLIGFANWILNFSVVALADIIDGAVFFPIFYGVPFVLIALSGFLFFGEKLTAAKIFGFAVGIAAVVLLNLPV